MIDKLLLITALAVLVTAMSRGDLRLKVIASGPGWECVFPRECVREWMDALPAQPTDYAGP